MKGGGGGGRGGEGGWAVEKGYGGRVAFLTDYGPWPMGLITFFLKKREMEEKGGK